MSGPITAAGAEHARSGRGRCVALVLGTVVVCAWCGWVSGFHRSTTAAEVTWLVSLGAVLAVDVCLWRGRRRLWAGWHLDPVAVSWPRPGRGGARLALLGVTPWLALVLVLLTWDVLGLNTGPHQHHLTISALAQAYRPLNAGLLLLWMLVGIGYEGARVRAPLRTDATSAAQPGHAGRGVTLGVGAITLGGQDHAVVLGLLLPQNRGVGVAFWVAVPVVAFLIDRAARRSHGRLARAEELVRFVSTSMAAHVVLVAAWVYAGYHLFAR